MSTKPLFYIKQVYLPVIEYKYRFLLQSKHSNLLVDFPNEHFVIVCDYSCIILLPWNEYIQRISNTQDKGRIQPDVVQTDKQTAKQTDK